MNKVTGFVLFVAGAAIGSVATWYYTNKKCEEKYKQIAQEEIESVKEVFAKNASAHKDEETSPDEQSVEEKAEMAREKPSVAEYAKILAKKGYNTNYSNAPIMVEDDEEQSDDPGEEPGKYFGDENAQPYVIAPEQFAELDEYDRISLTYYADHILADDDDRIMEDVEGTVGFESLTHFGEYEDDSVYVRNDRLKVDYEILRDERKYSDVIKKKPYLKED